MRDPGHGRHPVGTAGCSTPQPTRPPNAPRSTAPADGPAVSATRSPAAIAILASPLASATTGMALAWMAACRACGSGPGWHSSPRRLTAVGQGDLVTAMARDRQDRDAERAGRSARPPFRRPPGTRRRGGRRDGRITGLDTYDVRFPTSRTLAGSDAMNPAPDYFRRVRGRQDRRGGSRAVRARVRVHHRPRQRRPARRDPPARAVPGGPGPGRGTGRPRRPRAAPGQRQPLHWLGPLLRRGGTATGAVLNACWDLAARRAGKPLWLLLAEMSPAGATALVDFRYLSDVLAPDEALDLLERGAAGRDARSPRSAGTATRPTPPGPAGSAIPTGSWPRCAPRRSPAASPR